MARSLYWDSNAFALCSDVIILDFMDTIGISIAHNDSFRRLGITADSLRGTAGGISKTMMETYSDSIKPLTPTIF